MILIPNFNNDNLVSPKIYWKLIKEKFISLMLIFGQLNFTANLS